MILYWEEPDYNSPEIKAMEEQAEKFEVKFTRQEYERILELCHTPLLWKYFSLYILPNYFEDFSYNDATLLVRSKAIADAFEWIMSKYNASSQLQTKWFFHCAT